LIFAVIDFTILNASDAFLSGQNFEIFRGWSFGGIIHKFFLSFLVLFLGLLLVENNKRKQGVLIIYTLFLIAGHYGFFYGHISYLIIFQFFLFFSLMKRTAWLESLTRLELIVYFALLLWIFLIITEPSFVKVIRSASDENQTITYSLPYFTYLVIKLYWLALLVRIPIVVIYNHASLSRKLRIAGLFQSSFPLFIQLAALLVIFFLFISGWQAEQLRDRFMNTVDNMNPEEKYIIDDNNETVNIVIPGYQLFILDKDAPHTGVVALKRESPDQSDKKIGFFLYQKRWQNRKYLIEFMKVDETFLNRIAVDLKVLAGTGLIAYAYKPKQWITYISKLGFFDRDENIDTNPFGLLYPLAGETANGENRIFTTFPDRKNIYEAWSLNLHWFNINNPLLIVGRLNIPLVKADNPEHTVYQIDIFFDVRSVFQWNFMTQILLALIILFLIFNMFIIKRVVAFGAQINESVVQKFDILKAGIREVSSGNLSYKINLEGEDEFVELAGRFNQMGIRLQETIEEAREKDRLDQELSIARRVQLSLLKEDLPEIEGFNVSAILKTATEVGGDFYDLIPIDSKRFIFSIGDVSGKGSSAAFYMAQFMSLLRYSPKFIEDPQSIAVRLNEYIMNQVSDRQIFITAIIGIINKESSEIQLVRAGHNLPLLVSRTGHNAIKEIKTSGLGIGLSKSEATFKKSIKLSKFKIKNGEKLVLYTDGIVEARRPVLKNDEEVYEIYGEERFNSLLMEHRELSSDDLISAITYDLDTFYENNPRIDDFTLMIIEKI
ncbi:MAG: SpoIIE family protein phosphatase, partial [Calditrichaceae bacterium]